MIGKAFYNETIKNTVAVFGSLFNNLVLVRRDGKILPVPISYGPRQKWLEAQKGLQKEEELFEKLLPRASYELTAMNYDVNRKITNKQTIIREPHSLDYPSQRINSPVPYVLNFSLYLETKNLNDGWQLMEQILPFFTPSYTVRVRHFPKDNDPLTPQPTNTYDQPFILESVTWTDDWIGDVDGRRTIEWQMEFSTKVWMYGPAAKTNIILDSRVLVSTPPTGETLEGMNRSSSQEGVETGYGNILPTDSEVVFTNDSDFSPNILNLFDSEGNIVKVIRSIDTL